MASGIRSLSESSLRVEMESFKDLLKIADEKIRRSCRLPNGMALRKNLFNFMLLMGNPLFYNINAD